jgi:hypothetical protein
MPFAPPSLTKLQARIAYYQIASTLGVHVYEYAMTQPGPAGLAPRVW